MHSPKLLFILLLIVALTGVKSDDLPSAFTSRLERAGMTFTSPVGFVNVSIVKNGQMHYEYAIKDPGKNFEIRYAIRPLDSLFKQYAEMQNNAKPFAVARLPAG